MKKKRKRMTQGLCLLIGVGLDRQIGQLCLIGFSFFLSFLLLSTCSKWFGPKSLSFLYDIYGHCEFPIYTLVLQLFGTFFMKDFKMQPDYIICWAWQLLKHRLANKQINIFWTVHCSVHDSMSYRSYCFEG